MAGRSLRPRHSTPSYALKLDIGESDDDDDDELDGGSSGEDELSEAVVAPQEVEHVDASMADAAAAATSSTVTVTPRGRGRGAGRGARGSRGTPRGGRGRGRGGRGAAASTRGGRRSGSFSSGSDYAAGSAEGGPSSEEDDDNSSDAYSSSVGSLRAISDEDDDGGGLIGDSDLEQPTPLKRHRPAGQSRASAPSALPKPGVLKTRQKRKNAGGKASAGGMTLDERKREDIWTFSEGNPPLVPHFTSYLTAPPSLRARSAVFTPAPERVPQRPMRIEEVTGRVRTFTAAIHGMTPWDAWAGDGWRPDSSSVNPVAGARPTTNGWEGVEKGWVGLRMLTAEQAAPHLPAPTGKLPLKLLAGHLTPSSPQTECTLPVHSSSSLASHGIRKTGAIFNPGGPVWSVDWCPMTEEQSEKRDWKLYLAVAAHSSLEADVNLGQTKPAETPGSIQIWSVGPTAGLVGRQRRAYHPKPVVKPELNQEAMPQIRPPEQKSKADGDTPKRKGGPPKVKPPATTDDQVDKLEHDGNIVSAPTLASNGDALLTDPAGEATFNVTAESFPTSASNGDAPVVDFAGGPAPDGTVESAPTSAFNSDAPVTNAAGEATPDGTAGDVEMADGEAPEEDDDISDEWELEASLAMVVCVEGGQPCRLQWCPSDSADPISSEPSPTTPKLGVLAGTFEDGTVKLFAVPDPDALRASQQAPVEGPLYVHVQPLTTLELDDSMLISLDWGSGRVIATGSSKGQIATWDVKGAAVSGDVDPLPLQLLQVHDSPIRSISYVRAPQADATGQYRFDWEQHLVMTSGNNRLILTDLRESEGIGLPLRIGRSSSCYASAASIQNGTVIVGDGDYQAYLYAMRPRGVGMMRRAVGHQGAIWDLSTSDYHPNLASASADGSLMVTNTLRGTTKNRGSWVTLMENVYRMDKNSLTGELRMLDNLLPQSLNTHISLRTGSAVGATRSFSDKALGDLNARHASSQAWSPDVGVLSTAWNTSCGIGRAGLLASGTACGLARIDVMVDGRWRPGPGRSRETLRERLRSKEIFL